MHVDMHLYAWWQSQVLRFGSGQEYAGHLCNDPKSAEKSAAEQALQAIFKESPCLFQSCLVPTCIVQIQSLDNNRLAYHSRVHIHTSNCPWSSTNPSLEPESRIPRNGSFD